MLTGNDIFYNMRQHILLKKQDMLVKLSFCLFFWKSSQIRYSAFKFKSITWIFKLINSKKRHVRLYMKKKTIYLLSHREEDQHRAWHSSTAADWSHYNALPYHYWHTQTDRRQTHRGTTRERRIAVSTQVRDRAAGKESLRVNTWLNILMKETCADRVGPRAVSLLCLSGKTKGHNRATVLFRVSIGDNFYLPVKGRGLQGQ